MVNASVEYRQVSTANICHVGNHVTASDCVKAIELQRVSTGNIV